MKGNGSYMALCHVQKTIDTSTIQYTFPNYYYLQSTLFECKLYKYYS